MAKFIRKVRVTFQSSSGGGIVVNPNDRAGKYEMKVSFRVSRDISSDANTASISIWNLSPENRAAVGKELDQVTLEAGYQDEGLGIIFQGQLRDVEHRRDNVVDIVTTLASGDGDRALRGATIAKTYEAGTPVEDVVSDIYSELEAEGVKKGEWVFPTDTENYERPYSVYGPAARELDTLGRGHNFYWSIQNGTMEVIPGDGALAGTILVSAKTGMENSPTITDNGIKVTSMLNPEARPNRQVTVESTLMEGGTFRISRVDFYGDNKDGRFSMTIHGERLQGSTVDEGVGVETFIKGIQVS